MSDIFSKPSIKPVDMMVYPEHFYEPNARWWALRWYKNATQKERQCMFEILKGEFTQ